MLPLKCYSLLKTAFKLPKHYRIWFIIDLTIGQDEKVIQWSLSVHSWIRSEEEVLKTHLQKTKLSAFLQDLSLLVVFTYLWFSEMPFCWCWHVTKIFVHTHLNFFSNTAEGQAAIHTVKKNLKTHVWIRGGKGFNHRRTSIFTEKTRDNCESNYYRGWGEELSTHALWRRL